MYALFFGQSGCKTHIHFIKQEISKEKDIIVLPYQYFWSERQITVNPTQTIQIRQAVVTSVISIHSVLIFWKGTISTLMPVVYLCLWRWIHIYSDRSM